jgi:Tfp pilus assembly protein PilE
LEIATALTLVAVFSAIAVPTWQAYEERSARSNIKMLVRSLEPEVVRVMIENNGSAPADTAARMRVGNPELVNGSNYSQSSGRVSVGPLPGDITRAVVAVQGDDGSCWVASISVDGETRWAVDEDPVDFRCRAGHPAVGSGSVVGTESSPAPITIT